MSESVIGGKRRPGLSQSEKAMLRSALHTEGVLTGDYAAAVNIRRKLGLGALASEREE